ncbi:hypothetical protein NIES4074_24050 [Cylindrospermum sp. NIES-4074]|nr:hypothetical protein NIES4074_24050 [Cylindrospermum sp. NIES-4074]
MSMSEMTALGALMLTVITNVVWIAAWYVGNQKSTEVKKYAAERDFNHLKNNQLQISESINHLMDEVKNDFDSLQRDILEIKITLGLHNKKDSG